MLLVTSVLRLRQAVKKFLKKLLIEFWYARPWMDTTKPAEAAE
jgi:hypothetical protein